MKKALVLEADSYLEHLNHFTKIYDTNEWGGSGGGSFPQNTIEYREILDKFIRSNNIKTVYDFGCGDWQFTKLIDWSNVDYTGVDCVKSLIDNHNEKYKTDNINFIHMLNFKDFFDVKGDMVILKDVLQHWRNDEIILFLDNIKSNFKYVWICNSCDQKYDWQDEPDRSRPLSIDFFPLKKYNFKKIKTITSDGRKEISILKNSMYISGDNFKFIIADEYIDEDKKYIDLTKAPKCIFLKTDWVKIFINKILPKIDYEFTLITHNSDYLITSEFLELLNDTRLKKWYAMNCYIDHPKLFPIPIGIANEKFSHGNFEKMISFQDSDKSNLVYKNFDIKTNFKDRTECETITTRNGIKMQPTLSTEEYWSKLSQSKFAISPPGKGVDCHRIWECLYLKTVPVVKYHEALSSFSHLPILFVKDWNDVTEDFLIQNIDKFSGIDWCIKELDIDYYKD